ncbi:MAG: 4'-phosphopantetheinyl transferase superfamily protein [Bacteroidota bacterium]
MPLYKKIDHDSFTQVFIWKITESFEQLSNEIQLCQKSSMRLNGMKSESHQKGFLSVRKLVQEAGYSDFDLYYDESGKPNLNDGKFISITHSHEFSAIIISNKDCGIDIELQREKITRIADKFIDSESVYLNEETKNRISMLTVIWGAKESVFKIQNEPGISFKDHINVTPFQIKDGAAKVLLNFNGKTKYFKINFMELEGFTLVYAFENT